MKSSSLLWFAIITLGAILLFTGGWTDLPMMGYGMMGGGWMGGGMWIFWLFIAVGAYFLFAGMPWYERDSRRRPLRIAEERYARGEITADEVAEIRDNLESR